MSDVISPLLQWLNANPHMAGLVTFIISAAESVAIIGTIVPGSIMMTALGTLAGAGVIPLWPTIFWAIMGAIAGDGISYWMGYHFKDRLPSVWPFRNYPGILVTGEVFVQKYGGMSVFIGRFVGPVRALVPLVAGMLGMRPLHFLLANITSAIGWAPAYMLPGILLGAASLELPPDIAIHVILMVLLFSLFIMLCLWFSYKIIMLINYHTHAWQLKVWQRIKHSKRFTLITNLLKHHNPTKPHGQLRLAAICVIATLTFLWIAYEVYAHGSNNLLINDAVFHFFRGIRNPVTDAWMINLTILGQKQVLIPVVIVLCLYFLISKHYRAAFHTLALGVLATGSVYVIKNIIQSPRPMGSITDPSSFSMPSGHSTLSMTLFMGLAFLIASTINKNKRWPLYTIAFLLAAAVAISRLYLSAHWFTDIIGAWLLSTAFVTFIVISYQRKNTHSLNAVTISIISILTLIVSFTIHRVQHYEDYYQFYQHVEWPAADVDMAQWWQHDNQLPSYHTSLFGFPSQIINVQWVGKADDIRRSLTAEGWTKPPARDFISVIHRIADVRSTSYLPLVSLQYLDKHPYILVTRQISPTAGLLVLRLWSTNRVMKGTNLPLWVGLTATIPRSYSWLYQKHLTRTVIDPALLFPAKKDANRWQMKTMMIDVLEKNQSITPQKVLLIRPRANAQ